MSMDLQYLQRMLLYTTSYFNKNIKDVNKIKIKIILMDYRYVQTNRFKTKLDGYNNSDKAKFKHVIDILRMLDSIHDLVDRPEMLKRYKKSDDLFALLKGTIISVYITHLFGDDYRVMYINFCENVLGISSKTYNNIKEMKTQMHSYLSENFFFIGMMNNSRRRLITYKSDLNQQMKNITPSMFHKELKARSRTTGAGFVINATKYSIDSNMRLRTKSFFERNQYITFSQLLDPSSIAVNYKKYVFHIQNNITILTDEGNLLNKKIDYLEHINDERPLLLKIFTFYEMFNKFEYYYICKAKNIKVMMINHRINRNNIPINHIMTFLEPNEVQNLSLLCFRIPYHNHDISILPIYILNDEPITSRVRGKRTLDTQLKKLIYSKYTEMLDPHLRKTRYDIYAVSSFRDTTTKLSIEKLLNEYKNKPSQDVEYKKKILRICLDYKRSFDSVQMLYHSDINLKQRNTDILFMKNEEDEQDFQILAKSSIITHDILAGLFGIMYGANLYLEYRGTYRHYSDDSLRSNAIHSIGKQQEQRYMLGEAQFLIQRLNNYENEVKKLFNFTKPGWIALKNKVNAIVFQPITNLTNVQMQEVKNGYTKLKAMENELEDAITEIQGYLVNEKTINNMELQALAGLIILPKKIIRYTTNNSNNSNTSNNSNNLMNGQNNNNNNNIAPVRKKLKRTRNQMNVNN